MRKHIIKTPIALLSLLCSQALLANEQLSDNTPRLTALTHANLMLAPGELLTDATLLIENRKIKAIIKDNDIPKDAFEIDLSGHTIYSGFIDPFTEYAIDYEREAEDKSGPVYEIKRIGGNASNGAIHSQMQWFNYVYPDKEQAKKWIDNGFTSVQSSYLDGIFRGQGVTLSLADKKANDVIYNAQTSQFMAFNKGSSVQDYPQSLMGSMALIRQTFADAKWYNQNKNKSSGKAVEFNIALERLADAKKQNFIFETKNLNNQLRAAQLLNEYELSGSLIGNGREYARLIELKSSPFSLVLPLNYPAAPEITDGDSEREVSLASLRHWERAPSNLAMVEAAEIPFALTQYGIESDKFWPRLKLALTRGLSEDAALAALTTDAAEIAGIEHLAGKLEPGFMADLVITDGNIFDEGKIVSIWLQGEERQLINRDLELLDNTYQLQLNELSFDLNLTQSPSLTGTLSSGEDTIELANLEYQQGRLTFSADLSDAGFNGISRFTLWLDNQGLTGRLLDSNNQMHPFGGITLEPIKPVDKQEKTTQAALISRLTSPNVAYGLSERPAQDKVHLKNATIWTSDSSGILENSDLIISRGKIKKIGTALKTPSGYTIIDATGKHVTAGIIDEHSHIALNGGTNEGSDAITSEVRIGDVINPDDIAIYRGLAGGVTTAQILHGSANPIGGQAQIIQLKWGDNAQQLKFEGAPASIKFALGENVKQSNWGDDFTHRFPQSRIGVKSLFSEAFNEALAYRKAQADYNKMRSSERRRTVAPQYNYRLEAVAEVLEQTRNIHIHSYVQSEILMFLRLAEAYNFKVSTFTHILEGYKVADEMAKHGAHASTFSDWWAYKFEVYDAIPQNTCLMQDKGVLTSINSDDYEMQRRLNQEAAKSMMYCGMSAEDAWKMITINPAIQLGIQEQVGSLVEGKQADVVLWDNTPLSVYAKVDSTWIAGRRYFSREQDKALQTKVTQERAALIQKVLLSDDAHKQGETPMELTEPEWHCDTHFNAWQQSAKGAL
ncbi:amidohydrolase family protein [Shewanella schlegeliana]|uniref:Amidohydrolase family protein n=1 Tax=Shewanella schlegeliana TaxID=190308 RepID=A0ABS1SXW8_9GAMM|nr:amidohydrolase family protein [Shewanella schlegeliana]MBL4913396.1 amidohydrolase family protein [Shewanella schlegeliana]MCL1108285.1 amidohydrolase family protein [Shewanella schlegeliana]GIU34593.1 periplasmic amidohydrolase [Shewanella schlegeliana]